MAVKCFQDSLYPLSFPETVTNREKEKEKKGFSFQQTIFLQALEVMGKLMKDCWKQNASARLPSLRVKKTLSKLMEMLKPAPINTSLSESEESSAIQDVNIHIPETLEIIKV